MCFHLFISKFSEAHFVWLPEVTLIAQQMIPKITPSLANQLRDMWFMVASTMNID